MDHLYTVCVILCLFTTAVAFSEADIVQWRTHMEERMAEMLQMIQRQNKVIEKQTNTIEKQSGEIELLRNRVKTLEERTDNSETSNEKSTDLLTGNDTAATSIERELHSEGMIVIYMYVESLFLLYLFGDNISGGGGLKVFTHCFLSSRSLGYS